MAERRMFAKTIVTSDAFLDMPATTRCLYFTLAMFADDDGFVNSPKSIMRQSGASEDDLKILFTKRYILGFDSGVIVIKHWKIHNLIQKDRYKETVYLEEKAQLVLDDKKAYTEAISKMDTPCIQSVSKMEPQVSIGKDSIGKDRVCLFDNYNILQNNISESEQKQAIKQANEPIGFYGVHKNIGLTDKQYKELDDKYSYSKQVINSLSEYKYRKGITGTVKDYDVLLEWLEKDKGRYEGQPGSFGTDDFFEAALKRSYRREI